MAKAAFTTKMLDISTIHVDEETLKDLFEREECPEICGGFNSGSMISSLNEQTRSQERSPMPPTLESEQQEN